MLNRLLRALSQRPSGPEVCNQYENPALLKNLKVYLEHMLRQKSPLLLVGEAPGHRGCRRTGIPFTSEAVIQSSDHPFFQQNRDLLLTEDGETESTATLFWRFFCKGKPLPVLWNAFPFHPHQKGNPNSNRKPTAEELREGEQFLLQVHNLFKPAKVCSIGRVGEACLARVLPVCQVAYVRHPSRGGNKQFVAGMRKFLSSTRSRTRS